jgi:hypothetical protein
MNTATPLKTLDHFTGEAVLYRLDPPLPDSGAYVVVSATVAPFSGPETYIFTANEDGEVTEWLELPGSFRGGLDHEQALRGLGYTISRVA